MQINYVNWTKWFAGIELTVQALICASVKVSVESVVESLVSRDETQEKRFERKEIDGRDEDFRERSVWVQGWESFVGGNGQVLEEKDKRRTVALHSTILAAQDRRLWILWENLSEYFESTFEIPDYGFLKIYWEVLRFCYFKRFCVHILRSKGKYGLSNFIDVSSLVHFIRSKCMDILLKQHIR